MRKLFACLGAALLAAIVAAGAQAFPLIIGSKEFTEQRLLGEITAQYLAHLGYEVERSPRMDSTSLRKAQEKGQVDLYWEYTGTALLIYNKVDAKLSSPDAVYQKVKALDAQKALVWLEPSRANNTYALAMRRADTEAYSITTLSELARALNGGRKLTLATNGEWYARDDGLKALQKAYDFKIEPSRIMRLSTGLTQVALNEGLIDIALVFATDGRNKAFDLVLLKDDKGFFPAYQLAPVVHKEALAANPRLAKQLSALTRHLDNETLSTLNALVDVDRISEEEVAKNFLLNSGLM
ncbi:glycine/betaine ABC transporter substrate-binding protein [Marinobacterium sp. D7]|uniref:glycine betaine ABC transporter substrate-binding protein n=1 Tax=Marinobacterium ramblicola TaxID=2849041 RepID=UPI001C2D9A79|nr:glycine betaine ABC transporter substrate-binding protein [Marinobacterium ramblicola]MBV1787962.1 glycine/betaine ABC transporter substrate-binding protein [Marinobacterium ramblicola]